VSVVKLLTTLNSVNYQIDQNILLEFVHATKKLGDMKSYTQAAGGNTSYKFDAQTMLIKASGTCLADLDKDSGYSLVYYDRFAMDVKRDSVNDNLNHYSDPNYPRPSLESSMHCLLGRFVFHLHPIYLYQYLCHENGQERFRNKSEAFSFPWEWVDYHRPGKELATAILKTELIHSSFPVQLYLLQNHGIIISLDHLNDLDSVLIELEEHFSTDPLVEIERGFSKLFDNLRNEIQSSLCFKVFSSQPSFKRSFYPLTPDDYIYWGFHSIEVSSENLVDKVLSYKQKYKELPKVLIFNSGIVLMESTLAKLDRLFDVFESHYHFVLQHPTETMKKLSENELVFLRDWEAEKYRKQQGPKA